MKRCTQCRRHVHADEVGCPFCGRRFSSHTAVALMALSVGMAGCGDDRVVGDEGGSAGTETHGSSTTLDDADPSTSTSSGTGDSAAESDTADDWTAGGFLYGLPDGGYEQFECDVWEQDCRDGEKCMPWDNTGQGLWNATKCTPVSPDPAQPGEPCQVEGSHVSGIDSCELGSVCWHVDPTTNEGVCVAQCTGTADNSACDDPDRVCVVANYGVLNLCLSRCDPLAPDCPAGDVCAATGETIVCMPKESGSIGGYAEPCYPDLLPTACDAGLFCAPPEAVPECRDAFGCCTAYCDLGDDDPDATCTDLSPGLACTPVFPRLTAPEGHENLGACLDDP
jgi:hypothetical protein